MALRYIDGFSYGGDHSGKTLTEEWHTFTDRERNIIMTAMEWAAKESINVGLIPFMDRRVVVRAVREYLQSFGTSEPELTTKFSYGLIKMIEKGNENN